MPINRHRRTRAHDAERGNIVLISALMVMALGSMAIGLSWMVQSRMANSGQLSLSNYAGSLALNAAESGINYTLYRWNSGLFPPPGLGFPIGNFHQATPTYNPMKTTYASGFVAETGCTYSIKVNAVGGVPPAYDLTADATATTYTGNVPWPDVTRRVTVRVASSSAGYIVTDYRR